MSIIYDAIVKTGTYQKDGVEKNKWTKVGVVMKTKQGGLALKLDTIPTNSDWNGWVSLSEPKAKDGSTPPLNTGAGVAGTSGIDDDSVPF